MRAGHRPPAQILVSAMPPRPKVFQLPDDLKAALDQELIRRNFADYHALEDWINARLQERGLELTLSQAGLQRYGVKFSERLQRLGEATQMAKAISQAAGDDEGALNEAVLRLAQEHVFQLLLDMEQGGDEVRKYIPKLTRAVADMSRASVQQNKFRDQIKEKLSAALDEAERADADPRAVLKKIREEIYGL